MAISDLGSLRKAADALCITQPAATAALKDLELTLGAPLFDRSKAGMEPTLFGRLLVERSRLLLGNIRATALEIQQLKDGDSGEVRVGTLPSSALTIVPQAIAIGRREKPGIVLNVVEGAVGQLLPALKRGDLDMVVGRIPLPQIGSGFLYEIITSEPNVVVCRSGHPLCARDEITLRDLSDQEWILPEDGAHFRSEWREAFLRAGLEPPQPVLVTSSTAIRVALLATTNMIGILSRQAAETKHEQGVMTILEVDIYRQVPPSMIVTRAGAMLTPASKSFAAFLRMASNSSGATDIFP